VKQTGLSVLCTTNCAEKCTTNCFLRNGSDELSVEVQLYGALWLVRILCYFQVLHDIYQTKECSNHSLTQCTDWSSVEKAAWRMGAGLIAYLTIAFFDPMDSHCPEVHSK